jgi:antitoxin MazE
MRIFAIVSFLSSLSFHLDWPGFSGLDARCTPKDARLLLGSRIGPCFSDDAYSGSGKESGAICGNVYTCGYTLGAEEAMRSQLTRWGNSVAVRVPKRVLEDAQLSEGDAIEITVTKAGVISLRGAQKKLTLESLLAGVTEENLHQATDWGKPVGKEAW